MSKSSQKELNFRQSVDLMFNRAASFTDIGEKMIEKIRVCNATPKAGSVLIPKSGTKKSWSASPKSGTKKS